MQCTKERLLQYEIIAALMFKEILQQYRCFVANFLMQPFYRRRSNINNSNFSEALFYKIFRFVGITTAGNQNRSIFLMNAINKCFQWCGRFTNIPTGLFFPVTAFPIFWQGLFSLPLFCSP
jgi:hypothetical protein